MAAPPTSWIGADPANFKPGRPGGFQPQAIVIHIMDGTLAGTDAWFNDPHAQVSAHYGVGDAGALHQYVKETDTAFHAGVVQDPTWTLLKPRVNPNFYTVGVEHEGVSAEPYPWPEPQLSASLALVRDIAARWGIPLDADHIVPHHMIRASKTCPGVNFDLADYVARLNAGIEAPAAAGAAAASVGQVTTTANANVRSAPTTASRTLRVLAKGQSWSVAAAVTNGEDVAGVALWYQGVAGGYLWAAATDHPSGLGA
jgi:N-acetylmuramoyl-L-alanine amidase